MFCITNGVQTLTVTSGAYTSIYAPQGWKPVSTSTQAEMPEEDEAFLPDKVPDPESENASEAILAQESDDEGDEEENLSEIPLTEMGSAQLRKYAKQLGVDIKGLTSKKAVRDRIRAVL